MKSAFRLNRASKKQTHWTQSFLFKSSNFSVLFLIARVATFQPVSVMAI